MSTWLDHRMPRYLVKNDYWVCLWGCLGKRLAGELVVWVKAIVVPSVSKHHPIHGGHKGGRRENPLSLPNCGAGTLVSCLWTGLTPSALQVLRPFVLDWNYTTGFPGAPACGGQIMKLCSLYNCLSQFFRVTLYVYDIYIWVYVYCLSIIYYHLSSIIYILLVLFFL